MISIAPAVDGLFGIAHHQRQVPLSQRFAHGNGQIVPLRDRGVLELIDKNVIVALSGSFENKRRRILRHYIGNHGIQATQGAHIFFGLHLQTRPTQRGEGSNQRQALSQQSPRSVIPP